MNNKKYHDLIIIWLKIGLVLVFFQIVIGGITRLTGSGLSITRWEIVTGTFPPSSDVAWDKAFDLYKDTPQYKKINQGMSLSEFKFIYFWEYFHRLWARSMGIIFLIPLIFFLIKGWIDRKLLIKLATVFCLALLAAAVGWIMVASGLIDRPWVSAYKLSIHLIIGFALFAYLYWTYLYAKGQKRISLSSKTKRVLNFFFILLWVQIFFGGMMSGMKAGLSFPQWPDIGGDLIPQVIFNNSEWTVENFSQYENSLLLPGIVHFFHRTIAYLLFGLGLYFIWRLFKTDKIENKTPIYLFITLLISQVILGILTLVNCIGQIPLWFGVLHQAFAILLLTSTLYWFWMSKRA